MAEERIVVVTGLGQGMGREVARLLAARGWHVAGFDVDAAGVRSLADDLGSGHLLTTADVCDHAAVRAFRDAALDAFGHVDVVLSNVGVNCFGPFEEADLDQALRCLEINVLGAARIFQAFLPSMRARRAGRLVAVTSMVGQVPFPFGSIYAASKFALEGLLASLRFEVEPFGIQVAVVRPAQVSTTFAAKGRVLPAETSPYRDRARRFVERDEALIKSAPTAARAAATITEVVEAERPPLATQIDAASTVFLWLNKLLPAGLRDAILLRHLGID
jgi:NAD(P)-dependent dehydrogenase (short-subunit alcohol dehydrogenase family)